MLVVLIGVSTFLQFIKVTALSGQMLTLNAVSHLRKVFSSQMNLSCYCTRQMADIMYGVLWVFADVNTNKVTHGEDGVMVLEGVSFGNKHKCILLMAF